MRLYRFICMMLFVLILLCGCCNCDKCGNSTDNTSADMSADDTTLPEETTVPGEEVRKMIKDYIQWTMPADCFSVGSYEDLQAVYAEALQVCKNTQYLSLGGNWGKAYRENTYDEEFFKTGFVVVFMFRSGTMENTIKYNVNSVDDNWVHIGIGSYGLVEGGIGVEYPAAYLVVIPVEHEYTYQQPLIVHTHMPNEAPPAN